MLMYLSNFRDVNFHQNLPRVFILNLFKKPNVFYASYYVFIRFKYTYKNLRRTDVFIF